MLITVLVIIATLLAVASGVWVAVGLVTVLVRISQADESASDSGVSTSQSETGS